MSIADAKQRRTALDPLSSFCVSAPAGSGKTELLIQRFLCLLARVQKPEQVLAITFTRKAAAEMRERVLAALLDAAVGTAVTSPHQQLTRDLAEQALRADAEHGWHLSRDVNRLNIRTIDGFCASLTRQMPVLSEFGGQVQATDDAAALYGEAVQSLFAVLETEQPLAADLRALLAHFDNHWQRLQQLLESLLARRDQWREYVGVRHEPGRAEALLLQTVEQVVEESLQSLALALQGERQELLELQRYAAGHAGGEPLAAFPGTAPADLGAWRSLRALLLTRSGTWRRKVDKRCGFPAGTAQERAYKAQMLALLQRLADDSALLQALAAVETLPEVATDSRSWNLALHLSHILPRLAAELLLVFSHHGVVDHSQVALSALQALGEDDAPTELALRLDYRIEHILVDEFQDTAINQFELVRRLTRGWGSHNEENPGAPRTLLVVGDGMQSIYGFRDANVGLFLKAREEGFNGVSLTPLQLQCNFRSDQGVVAWVNNTFSDAFPATDDLRRGQIRFTGAVAVREAGPAPAVSCHGFTGEDARAREIDFLCGEIQAALQDDGLNSIAVLGRSRPQLQPLMAALRARGVAYSAQDMDSLADAAAVIDLMSLCRALSNPADRVAWLALLRAPWCGLSLQDMHALCAADDEGRRMPFPAALQRSEGLSEEGLSRLARLREVLQWADAKRDRLALRVWVEQIWLRLDGPAALASEAGLDDAEQFMRLLELAEGEGVGLDTQWLQRRLDKLRVSRVAPGKLQIMTLHKAKGLEFDQVFIPALERGTRSGDRELLLWDDFTAADGSRGFLLAADDGGEAGGLYTYLREQRQHKSLLESTRLLYVGATRAVSRLVLSAGVTFDDKQGQWKSPPGQSLLACIWPTFSRQMQVHEEAAAPGPGSAQLIAPLLRVAAPPVRSAASPKTAQAALAPAAQSAAMMAQGGGGNIPERSLNRFQRHVGTVVHQALEELSQAPDLPPDLPEPAARRWQMALRQLGLTGEELEQAWQQVRASVQRCLGSEQGRWLLSSRHREGRSEWPLTALTDAGAPRDLVIDRSFIDADSGERWIIDYKTSQPEDGLPLEHFLEREAAHYEAQLRAYASTLQQLGEPGNIRCALYFTALDVLHELAPVALTSGR